MEENKLTFDENPENKYYAMLKPMNIKNSSFFYLPNKINKIGRSAECDIIFTVQALLEFCDNGDIVLRDLNSSNGCWVNDQQLKDGMPIFLNNNDKLRFGKDSAVYQIIINQKNKSNYKTEYSYEEERNKLASNGFSGNIHHDNKVSLVNYEALNLARRNHLENLNKNNNHNRINQNQNPNYNKNETKSYVNNSGNFNNENMNIKQKKETFKSNNNQKILRESHLYSYSPKFNSSIAENENEEFDVTFKNGKNLTSSKKFNNEQKTDHNLYEGYEDIQNQMQERLEFFRSEKIKFEKRNLEVEKKLSEKNDELKKISDNFEKNKEEFSKLNSKHNGLLLFASDLQKKIESIDIELLEKKQDIFKFSSSDWGKLLTEKDQVIKILQNDLAFYRNEINKIKNFLGINKKMIPVDLAKRVDHLIDSYISENKKYKRIVEEYRSKDDQCTKKWSELLKENNSNKDKINFLTRQINDQAEQFNSFMAENDRKLVDALNNIQYYIENFESKKREAAEYLVKQMNTIMEERRKLTEDNIILDNKLSIMKFEYEKVKEDNLQLNEMFNKDLNNINVMSSMNSNFNYQNNTNSMKNKIEELEDRIAQQNTIMDPFKISDLENIISDCNRDLSNKNAFINSLNIKIKEILGKPNYIFDEKQACFALCQAAREKDVLILDLKKALRDMKEREYKNVIDDKVPSYNFNEKNVGELYQNYQYGIDSNHPNNYIEKIEDISEETSIPTYGN